MITSDMPYLSIILPAYNEGDEIYHNIIHVCEIFETQDVEVILVDDGSADQTADAALRAKEEGYPVEVVLQKVNQGKGAALFRGFAEAKGERIAFLDADLEISPTYLLEMLKIMDETGADVVAGVKDKRDNQFPKARQLMSKLYRGSVAFLFGLSITDTQTGIKLFKREVLEVTVPRMSVSRFAFDIELLLAASRFGYTIREYPVRLEYRRTGSFGRMNIGNIFGAFSDTLSIYARASFWRWLEPSLGMRIWMLLFVLGIFFFGIGVGKLLTPVILHGTVKSIFYIIAFQFLPTRLRDWLLLIGGFVLIVLGFIQLNKYLLAAFVRRDRGDDLAGIFRK